MIGLYSHACKRICLQYALVFVFVFVLVFVFVFVFVFGQKPIFRLVSRGKKHEPGVVIQRSMEERNAQTRKRKKTGTCIWKRLSAHKSTAKVSRSCFFGKLS